MNKSLPPPFRKQGQQIQADGEVTTTCDLWCREQIEEWAREAGAGFDDTFESVGKNEMWIFTPLELACFAGLVAEACAKVCEEVRAEGDTFKPHEDNHEDGHADGCNNCAAAIRERAPTNCRHCGGPDDVICAGQCRTPKEPA